MSWWTRPNRRGEQELALDKEIQFHIEERVSRLVESGLPEQEARRRVRLEFGGAEQVKEQCRDARSSHLLDRFLQDYRFALRSLRRKPGFVVTALCTLALGIGANTAIFSLISGVLLRPLPFLEPDRLVQLNQVDSRNGVGAVWSGDFENWRKHSTSFEGIFTYGIFSKNLYGIDHPERIATVRAERGLLSMLGTPPVAGRVFREDDPPNVAVITAGFWKRRFGGDPNCLGREILLDGESYTVIGVMPAEFQFPYRGSNTEIWTPWDLRQWAQDRRYRLDRIVARLRLGRTVDEARSELNTITQRLGNDHPDRKEIPGTVVTPLSEVIVGSVRPALLTLLGAVGVVLLIALANVTNLWLARGAGRIHEMALRSALGASRGRLVQQLLTESVLISTAGALVGLIVAYFGTNLLLTLAASRIPRAAEIGFDWRVFLFLLVAGLGAGIVFGLLPALAASRLEAQSGLKQAGASRSTGYNSSGGRHLRDGLVIAEIALSFILVIGAGLLLRAFVRLQNTPPGFAAESVLTMHMSISLSEYRAPGSYGRYLDEVQRRLEQIPGVQRAGFIQYLPLQNWGWTGFFSIPGRTPQGPGQEPRAELRYVSPGYFTAMGIPLRRGRLFEARDTADAPMVILVNEALTHRYFPNQDPIGQRTDRGTIVGIVGNVRQAGLDRPATPEIYYLFTQNTAATSDAGVSLVVRAQARPESLVNAVRNAIHEVNPRQALFNVKTMTEVMAESLGDVSLYLWLVGLFAGLALLLAIGGIYGVISHAVRLRTQEFAIRLALGAGRRNISNLVLGHGLILVAVGLAIGTAGTFLLARTLEHLVSSVSSPDAATLAAVGLLLSVVALAACAVPARRATRVDPNVALKYE